jgi:hypothetical protein
MRKLFVLLIVSIMLLVVGVPAMAEMNVLVGGGIDFNGYFWFNGSVNYITPMDDNALEFGVRAGTDSYDTFIGGQANYLWGYTPEESSLFFITGVAVIYLIDKGAGVGIDFGMGVTNGPIDFRLELPVIIGPDGTVPVVLFSIGTHF